MKFIKQIAAAAVLATAASATAQVAFNATLTAVGASGVNGAFGGSVVSPVPFGSTSSVAGGAGSASATGVAIVFAPQPGPAVANPTTVTSGTVTSGVFSANIIASLASSVQNPNGANNSNPDPSGLAVYIDVRTLTYTLALAPGTMFPVGNNTYTVTLFSGGTAVATGNFTANVAVVPEPETYAAAAALGLVGFGLWRRRNA